MILSLLNDHDTDDDLTFDANTDAVSAMKMFSSRFIESVSTFSFICWFEYLEEKAQTGKYWENVWEKSQG